MTSRPLDLTCEAPSKLKFAWRNPLCTKSISEHTDHRMKRCRKKPERSQLMLPFQIFEAVFGVGSTPWIGTPPNV